MSVGLGLLVILLLWVIYAFNRLVRQRNLMQEGWSGIDVQLKRRHDLIPSLVECVRGYQAFERTVLEDLTRLRSSAEADENLTDLKTHENALTGRLKTFFALAEAYPDLKASANFAQLSKQLVEIEDAIQFARRYYNGTVRDLNIRIESFPSNIVAGMFRFERAEFFEIETTAERSTPAVSVGD